MDPTSFHEIAHDRVRFPAACACCDGPVGAAETLPIDRGFDAIAFSVARSRHLHLPTCGPCHRRLAGRRVAWWAGAVTLAVVAPFAALVVMVALTPEGSNWVAAEFIAASLWVTGGTWWLRNRAAQAFTRRYLPAWIEDGGRGLEILTMGFRRESLARDVAALSGLTPEGAVPREGAGYREPAAQAPYAFVPPEPAPLSWWWFAVLGVGLLALGAAEYRDLAAHEGVGGTIRLHWTLMAVYRTAGKTGVAGTFAALGAGSLALAAWVRGRRRVGGA